MCELSPTSGSPRVRSHRAGVLACGSVKAGSQGLPKLWAHRRTVASGSVRLSGGATIFLRDVLGNILFNFLVTGGLLLLCVWFYFF